MKKVSGDGLIFLILDIFYQEAGENTIAHVAGLRFTGIEQHTILNEYKITVENVTPYQSGEFYKREMPCLLALIEQVKEPFDVIIIDGFVHLTAGKAGLSKHLYDNLTDKKPIISIAKNPFYGIDDCHAVYRGESKHPLYVTTQDIELVIAKDWVKNLQGKFRLPDIITKVDKLSREKNSKSLLDVEGIDVPNLTSEDILQAIRESRERPTVFDL